MTRDRQPEHIVVGTDGSLNAHAAIRWAIDHAREGDTVTLVHAWEPAPPSADPIAADADPAGAARQFIERECARANALARCDNVTIRGEAVEADPTHCLAGSDCDLVVVGTRGHSRVAEMLLGSVIAHLAQHCHRPLVIVPHEQP